MLKHLTEDLRQLLGLEHLSIHPISLPPGGGLKKVPLRGGTLALHIDAASDWSTSFRIKSLCEKIVTGDLERIELKQQQETLDREMFHSLSTASDFLSGDGDLASNFTFIPEHIDYVLLDDGLVVAKHGLDEATQEISLRRLERSREFSVTIGFGELFGFTTGSFSFIMQGAQPVGDLVKNICRIRILWLDRLKQESGRYLYDSLTGLGSRQKLLDDLAEAGKASLFLVNLTNFKQINRLYGQELGDQVLVQLAKQLAGFHRESRHYRLYADRFVVLVDFREDAEAETIALQKYLVDEPCLISSGETDLELKLMLEARVAVASGEASLLLEQANLAMRDQKVSGRNYVVYNASMQARIQSEIGWVERIRQVIKEEAVVPVYQSILDPDKPGAPTMFEALMRLRHGGKLHSPGVFMDAAHSSGLYLQLQRLMIERVMERFADRKEFVTINVSAADIAQDDLVDFLRDCANRHGFSLSRLVVELVENDDMRAFPRAFQHFIELTSMEGILIAVDDFGTGYSNFTYTQALAPDIIKLDRSLIEQIGSRTGWRMVKAIVDFSHSVGARTLAEGVSSAPVLEGCQEMGFDLYQGFHLSYPIEDLDQPVTVQPVRNPVPGDGSFKGFL